MLLMSISCLVILSICCSRSCCWCRATSLVVICRFVFLTLYLTHHSRNESSVRISGSDCYCCYCSLIHCHISDFENIIVMSAYITILSFLSFSRRIRQRELSFALVCVQSLELWQLRTLTAQQALIDDRSVLLKSEILELLTYCELIILMSASILLLSHH